MTRTAEQVIAHLAPKMEAYERRLAELRDEYYRTLKERGLL